MEWIGYGITSDGKKITFIGDLFRPDALNVLAEWNKEAEYEEFYLVDLFEGKKGRISG